MQSTKKRLLASSVALILCIAMLLGSTLAWFTASVSNTGNIIQSGDLEIGMYWSESLLAVDSDEWKDASGAPIFTYDNWEPGYTDVKYVKISNLGNLAFQWKLDILAEGALTDLADVIEVYYVNPVTGEVTTVADKTPAGDLSDVIANKTGTKGVLLPAGETSAEHTVGDVIVAIALRMDPNAGKEYQNMSIGAGFGIRLMATQYDYEKDGLGSPDYDGDAEWPNKIVADNTASAPVTSENGLVADEVSLVSDDGTISATVPEGVLLEDGVTNLTLAISSVENSQANVTATDDEEALSIDVHVHGVSANNTVVMPITVKELLPKGLNMGNYRFYHVENGATVEMTLLADGATPVHNDYEYDPATGDVVLYLSSFSEIKLIANKESVWTGGYDFSWYDAEATELTVANADQLAALSAIVGGMLDREADSFKGKTIRLVASINLGDKELENDPTRIFYPIGYYNSDGTYEKTGTAITSGFRNFEGVFDGGGHTISNFYQNTWEMKGDHEWYAPEEQYYRDGMGLFGRVYGGTVKNLVIRNFTSDGEITTTGTVASYADHGALFENIAIFNCNPRVYNIGNGGIVGCVGWYNKEVTETPVTFRNITVDNTNKISALWGSYDVACGGIVGQYYPTSGQTSAGSPKNAGIRLENCHVSAQMDVYNDVCANYQYYAYRYAGILIGSVRENVTIDGHVYPKMDGITAEGCTVHYGTWNDYYYCELVDNSLASYTHDHQMSRLVEIKAINGTTVTYLDGTTGTVPASGRANYVIVDYAKGHGTENAVCYHFKDGEVWTHDMAGTEVVGGETVLKEDKHHLYLEFNNLITGYGWGVTSKGVDDMDGVSILDRVEGNSVEKFEGKVNTLLDNKVYTLGEIFDLLDTGVELVPGALTVTLVSVDDLKPVTGTFVRAESWADGTIKLEGVGRVQIIIQDYYFCTPTVIEVDVTCNHAGGTATCYKQAICDRCGEAYGDKPAHSYTAATCQTPATCTKCGATTGGTNASNHVSAYWKQNELNHEQVCMCGAVLSSSAHTWDDDTCTTCGKVQNLIILHDSDAKYGSGTTANIKITFNGANANKAASSYGIYLYQGQNQVMAYMANNPNVSGFTASSTASGLAIVNAELAKLPAGWYTIRVLDMENGGAMVATKTIQLEDCEHYEYWDAEMLYNAWQSISGAVNGLDAKLSADKSYVTFTVNSNALNAKQMAARLLITNSGSHTGGYLNIKYRNYKTTGACNYRWGADLDSWTPVKTNQALGGVDGYGTQWLTTCIWTKMSSPYTFLSIDFYAHDLTVGNSIDVEYIVVHQGSNTETFDKYFHESKENHTHSAGSAVVENRVNATCTTPGRYDSVTYCTTCGCQMNRTTVTVPAVAHSYTSATCTSPAKCTVCGVISGAISGHSWTPATCTAPRTCSVCHTTEGSALGHVAGHPVEENRVGATCTEDGSYDSVTYCAYGCGHVMSRRTVTIPSTGLHNYVNLVEEKSATCTEDGYVIKACGCGAEAKTATIPATGHDTVVDVAVIPTCTTPGKTEGSHCSVCGEVFSAQTDLPATGHSWVNATCDTPKTCAGCGQTEGDALGHTYVDGKCTTCGAANPAPPVETPADTPVNRVDVDPHAYFDGCSGGYVAHTDATSIVGNAKIDVIAPQGTISPNYMSTAFQQGMTVTLPDAMCHMYGWVGINVTDYILGWNLGSDDYRWWSIDRNVLITPAFLAQYKNSAGYDEATYNDYAAVLAAANKAGYRYAIRFTYLVPAAYVSAGEAIHLWVKEGGERSLNDASMPTYCFAEIKVGKDGQSTAVGTVNLDVIKPAGSYPSYSKTATAITVPAKDLAYDREFALSGWVASNLTNVSEDLTSKYEIIVRINGQSYRSAFKNRTAELSPYLGAYSGYIAFEGTFKLNDVKDGDTLYLILVRKGTSPIVSGGDEEFVFASYTVDVADSDDNYDLQNTVTQAQPNTDKVTAPSEDANLKMWFNHLTQKVSRYDVADVNSDAYSYTIQMARNEMEGCHFYLYSPTNRKVTIKYSDFVNQYGETLETELGVEFYLEDGYINKKDDYPGYKNYMDMGEVSASGNIVAVYPDAVIPYESYVLPGFGSDEGGYYMDENGSWQAYEYGAYVNLGKYTSKNWDLTNYPYRDAIRGFTVQATTRRDTRPGTYTATIEIYDYETGECIKMANVTTTVYDVILSDYTELDTALGIWGGNYNAIYDQFRANGMHSWSGNEITQALADFLLEYRITPNFSLWTIDNVLCRNGDNTWLMNPRVTTFKVYTQEMYNRYKDDPILAEKMIYYGQDEPGIPRNQNRDITLEDGTVINCYDAYGILAMLGVAEEAKMLQSWGWEDYRLVIPFERNNNLADISRYYQFMKEGGYIPNMSWAAVEAMLGDATFNPDGSVASYTEGDENHVAKILYNKYKTELQNSKDMVDFFSKYVNVWTYIPSGSAPRELQDSAIGSVQSVDAYQGDVYEGYYMQDANYDAVYGEFGDRMSKYQAGGDELWMYVACEPKWDAPYQNILLFNDGTEARTMFWTAYLQGQTGFLYWREDYYFDGKEDFSDVANTYVMRNPFSKTGPGDGILIYPGAIYGQLDPIPSIRLINMRDGIEDYQLLCMIEEKYGKAKAMELVENIVTSTVTFTRDDNRVYSVHAEMLKLLED